MSAAVAAAAGVDPASAELELAVSRAPYVVVETDRARISVRVRGVEVDAVDDVRLTLARDASVPTAAVPPSLPAVWRVTEAPHAVWRRVIAPDRLIPHDAPAAPPAGTPTAVVPRPGRYLVETDGGWILAVGAGADRLVRTGLVERLRVGGARVLGQPRPPRSPSLVVEVPAEDAARLVHLFRPGLPVMVAADAAPVWSLDGRPVDGG